MLGYLLGLFPILVVLFTPWTYGTVLRGFKDLSWAPLFFVTFLYLILVSFIFQFQQLRYFAAAMPFFYLSLPWLLRDSPRAFRFAACGFAILSLLIMVATGYFQTIMYPHSPAIVPTPFLHPLLSPFYEL